MEINYEKDSSYVKLSVRYIKQLTNYSISRAFSGVGYEPERIIWEGKKVLIKFTGMERITEKAIRRAIKNFGVPKKVYRSEVHENLIYAQVG